MPPPKLSIYEAGCVIRDIRFQSDGYPPDVKVTFKDGKRIILYKKLKAAKRKEYVKHYRRIPYSEMTGEEIPPEKHRLYSAEVTKDYQELGLRQRNNGIPLLIIKKGGVYPATNQPISPQNSK